MSLRQKSFGVIVACLALFMAVVYAVFASLVTTRFAAIERDDTRLNVARVQDAIHQELASLTSKAGDWSNWDDSYSFAKGTNPGFVATNIVGTSYEELRVNLILLVDPNGEVLFGGAYDLAAQTPIPLPEGILEYLTPGNPLLRQPAESGELAGLVDLPNGPMLVASRPLLTTDGLGPSAGTLIFGRYLDAAEQAQLARQTHLSLQFRHPDDPVLPGDFTAAAEAMRLNPAPYVTPLSRDSIAGYDVLDDIQGNPALLLRIDASRPIHRQGQAMLFYSGIVILAVGLLAGIIITALLQRLFHSQLEKAEAEDRYRAVIEQAAEGILLIDPETKQILDANQSFFGLFGYDPAEMARTTLYDLDCGSRGEIDAAWRLVCEGSQLASSSRQWRHHDGHVLEVEMSAGRVVFNRRELMSCVVRDVSARRKAEQALRSSEERFRSVFDNSIIGIYQIAPDGRVLFANQALAHLLGFRNPEDMGRPDQPREQEPAYPGKNLRERIGEHGEIRGHVSAWKKSDGTTIHVRENARAVRDGNGAVLYYEGTVEDVTERVDAQEELQRRARYLEALNVVIGAGATATDAPGMMNACLNSTLKALGLTAGGVWLDQHHRFVGLSEDLGRALDGLESAFDRAVNIGSRSEIPPGHPFHSLLEPMARSRIRASLAFPVVSEGRRIGGLVLASLQPRAWRPEEIALGEAVASELAAGMHRFQMAERTQHQDRLAAVGQLAAGIAHDFNNILAAIILYAGMVMNEPGLSPRGVGRARTILDQSQRASSLVSQVLDFSRRSVLEMEPVDLLKFLREQIKLLERTLPESIRPVLLADEAEYPLRADVTRLQQVLLNLSTNARDAMPNGGSLTFSLERMTMTLEDPRPFPEMRDGDWLILRVADSGTGMLDEVSSHLFEPFFTTKPPGKGTGLGLSQVYGIVRQHEGYIDALSAAGLGTTFTIFFPALPTSLPEAIEPAPVADQATGETLLLVEDEVATREAMTEVLEGLGYGVISAENGRQALDLFHRHGDRVRLVISDMVMPELGGLGLYKELAQDRPGLRMILMTGYPVGGTGDLQGANGILRLQKPMSAQALAAAVKEALGGQSKDRSEVA